MNDNICYIVGSGENYGLDFTPAEGDFVIAADAGLLCLEEKGIAPDLIVGDFDTLGYIPQGENVLRLPSEKDRTDMGMAINEGIRAGYRVFHIYCGTGGRVDHTFANLQLIAHLSKRGMQGFLFDKDTVFTAVTDGKLVFDKIEGGYVSVFAWSDKAVGICLKNLKYELDEAMVSNTFPVGVSNEFIGKESSIMVVRGTLLVNFPRTAMGRILECVELADPED